MLINAIRELTAEITALRAELFAHRKRALNAEAAALLNSIRTHVTVGVLFTASELADELGRDANELGRALRRLEGNGLLRAGRSAEGVLWLLSVD